jgi:hypothetical protein
VTFGEKPARVATDDVIGGLEALEDPHATTARAMSARAGILSGMAAHRS